MSTVLYVCKYSYETFHVRLWIGSSNEYISEFFQCTDLVKSANLSTVHSVGKCLVSSFRIDKSACMTLNKTSLGFVSDVSRVE